MYIRPLAFVLFLGVLGCPTKGDDSTNTGDADTDADSDADSDTDADTDTYNISGTAVDFATRNPAAAGLCVVPVDPGPAITGGKPTPLGSAVIAAGGAFAVNDLTVKPALGLVVLVQDCKGEGTVYATGTGVGSSTLEALKDGETLENITAFSVSTGFRDGLVASFAAAGGSWDPATEGALMGFVLDSGAAPIGGATVTGTGSTTYYMDAVSADGLFTSSSGVNASTDPAAASVFAIPAAPITVYTATATGYDFDTITGGSFPGIVLFIAFYGT